MSKYVAELINNWLQDVSARGSSSANKHPAVDWLIVVYCSSVNFAIISATMSLYSINHALFSKKDFARLIMYCWHLEHQYVSAFVVVHNTVIIECHHQHKWMGDIIVNSLVYQRLVPVACMGSMLYFVSGGRKCHHSELYITRRGSIGSFSTHAIAVIASSL